MQHDSQAGQAISSNDGMKERVAKLDWSKTPLGPMDRWPASLRTSAGIVLQSNFPMFVWWGPDLINIYNDAYAPFLGKRHPQALGQPAREVWPEIWAQIGDEVDLVVKKGMSITKESQRFLMERNGYPEVSYYSYSHSPIPNDDGSIGGLFQVCIEETGRVQAEAERDRLATERERLLRAIDAERNNLAKMIEIAPSFVCITRGREQRFEYANQRYLDLVGGRQLIGKTVDEALPEVASQGFLELLDKVYTTGQSHIGNETLVMLQSPDGQLKPHILNFVYQALRDATGAISGVFTHGVDVTSLAQSRAELRERAQEFRQVTNAGPQIVWAANPTGVVDFYNERWFEYIQIPETEAGEKTVWSNFVHPDDTDRVIKAWSSSIHTGNSYRIEFRIRNGAGMYRWFLIRAEPARDEKGNIIRWYGNCTDIEDRKRIEERDRFLVDLDDAIRPLADPQEITAKYAELLGKHLDVDRCAYADVEADEDTFNLTGNYNRGVPSIVGRYRFLEFGREVLELMRANKPFIVNDVDHHTPPIGDLSAYRATKIQAVICVPLHKSGRFVAAMAVHCKSPRHWRSDEVELLLHVAGRCWESIERARIAREREQLLESEQAARAEAERAGRMKDEFLATLSHELRTPLNAILGWSQIIQRGRADADSVKQGLEVIERNARAQSQIIEDLLDMSRIISGKVRLDVQRVDLSSITLAAIETARPTAEAKGVRLLSVIDPLHGVVVTGDVNRLQQVLWNLLSNAIKFTPRGGRVQVLLERVNSHLEISVNDTGEGIRPEFLPFVFDRFRQADASTTRKHGGLGLGLSIVKQLVELHGGSVRVKSAGLGHGATFIVVLPLTVLQHESESDRQRRHPRAAPDMTGIDDFCVEIKGVRIVVVDDEPDARGLVQRILEDCDADVTPAATADDAIQLIATGQFDVLVSDIGMPGCDGYELIRRVRALGKAKGGDIPAIALTAYARAEDRVKAIAAGFQMHVAKPVEPVELITMVAGAAGKTGSSKF